MTPGLKTEVDLLAESLEHQSAADGEWDRGARVAACAAGLEDGADSALLARLFGQEVLSECLVVKSERVAMAGAASVLPSSKPSRSDQLLLHAIEESTNTLRTEIREFDSALGMIFDQLSLSAEEVAPRRQVFFRVLNLMQEWKRRQITRSVEETPSKEFFERFAAILKSSDVTASRLLEKIFEEAAHQLSHPLLTPARPKLGWTDILDSIARIQNAIAYYRPELIVAGNSGGIAIARLLTHYPEFSEIPVVGFDGHFDTEIAWKDSLESFERPKTVAIVGDLALSGKTATHVIRLLRQRFPESKVYCAVLASSAQALKETSHDCHLLYHQIAAVGFPEMEHGPIVGIEESDDKVSLVTKDNVRLPVPYDGLRLARNVSKERIQIEPTPWIDDTISVAP